MKVETRLPLGKLDPGCAPPPPSLDIRAVADDARRAEALGYDGIITEETKDDPYIVMALAAQATSRVSLATAVALAFPRSPTVTAMTAWTLQRLSGGRFTLGLGSQVKGHIERRFGMAGRRRGRGCASMSRRCARSGTAGRTARNSISAASTTSSI